ncbi:hypothetical protein P4H83_23245 [Paenibacillus favisporus]|uniref:hypothetical protein n=1 Tax=Paenibacillus favisporus TaxID=221028 RepID=UPI002DB7FE22|nr:hypothetical protein [Paenibacillus favisporus]MEC0177804.1 hypothetical protein [Paenibacillus favisporus]
MIRHQRLALARLLCVWYGELGWTRKPQVRGMIGETQTFGAWEGPLPHLSMGKE